MSFRNICFNKPYICLYNRPYWYLSRKTGLKGRYAIGSSIQFQVGKNMRAIRPFNQRDKTYFIWDWYTTKTLLPRQLNCVLTRETKVKLLKNIDDELSLLETHESKTMDSLMDVFVQDELGAEKDIAMLRLRSIQNLTAAKSMITRLLLLRNQTK